MIKIGFLGPSGTYSEMAVNKYTHAQKKKFKKIADSSFLDLFEGLTNNEYDEIIIPVENSIEGAINVNEDLLVQEKTANIIAEIQLPIIVNLMALPGTSINDITDLYSHAQPLAQCREYIHTKLKNAHSHAIASTALAAQKIQKEQKKNTAILGNDTLADQYNLICLDKSINNTANNITRFIILGTTETTPTDQDKTSIIFSTPKDQPGSLYNVLEEFKNMNINLTRITSRPTKDTLGEYLFYVDFEGHIQSPQIKNMMSAIKPKCSFFKWLGSYSKIQ